MSAEKYKDLSGLCMVLQSYEHPAVFGDYQVVQGYKHRAAALARELFPPMAKALAWSVDPHDDKAFISQLFIGQWYTVREFTLHTDDFGDLLRINCSICTDEDTQSIQWCASLDEAKAFCEAHHQARFKELLA